MSSKRVQERYCASISLLQERRHRAMQSTYRMGVIGVTSSGKSTLINSLLGEELLPAAVNPSSSQLVSCRYGESRSANIYFENKPARTLPSIALTPEIIKQYGEEQSNPKNIQKVTHIEICTPKFPFEKDLILVDSPGLDAYGFDGHEQLTLNSLLPSIDFCLFITTCKTNSDNKTQSVLNTIAQYEKPVIIIQNMIDSIKPSLDIFGNIRKTEEDVIEEHICRVRKIAEGSCLGNKSIIRIVPYSAIWAQQYNKDNNQALFERSGYNELVSAIKDLFNELHPNVESNRVQSLKNELAKIIDNARQDANSNQVVVAQFEYDGDFEILTDFLNQAKKRIENELDNLGKLSKTMESKTSYWSSDIEIIKKASADCSAFISDEQLNIYNAIKLLCAKLNISVTQLSEQSQFLFPADPKMSFKTKKVTQTKKQTGFGGSFKRALDIFDKGWGYETTTKDIAVLDASQTRRNIVSYLGNTKKLFQKTVDSWDKKTTSTVGCIEREIEKHHIEYENRIGKALESDIYLTIADTLTNIVSKITTDTPQQPSKIGDTRELSTEFSKQPIPKISYKISQLSNLLNDTIHKSIFDTSVLKCGKASNIIIGWDANCIKNFVRQNIGIDINHISEESTFDIGENSCRILYNKTEPLSLEREFNGYLNVFVLVSALQYGQVLTQLNNIKLCKFLNKSDNLFIVVQDFQEIINSMMIADAISCLRLLKCELNILTEPTIFLMHEIPIFNLVAMETQMKIKQDGRLFHKDETDIIDSIQKLSFWRMYQSAEISNNIAEVIKSLK